VYSKYNDITSIALAGRLQVEDADLPSLVSASPEAPQVLYTPSTDTFLSKAADARNLEPRASFLYCVLFSREHTHITDKSTSIEQEMNKYNGKQKFRIESLRMSFSALVKRMKLYRL
jgi:hypothetical protein